MFTEIFTEATSVEFQVGKSYKLKKKPGGVLGQLHDWEVGKKYKILKIRQHLITVEIGDSKATFDESWLVRDKTLSESKPSIADTYNKIKDFNLKALTGFARKSRVPEDAFKGRKNTELMIDEIMGYLYNDDWLQDLMDADLVEAKMTAKKFEKIGV